jgi:hypothetical protein
MRNGEGFDMTVLMRRSKPLSFKFAQCFFGVILLLAYFCNVAYPMDIDVNGSTVTMRGSVLKGDCERFRSAITGREIEKVILGHSNGGDADSGYCVGALIRENGIHTAIKGKCASSCSRMWLGGVSRVLLEGGAVGLHGNYASNGHLMAGAPERLRSWIVRFAPNVDRRLMEEWINLPLNKHMMYFFNEKALLCDASGCNVIKGRNVRNAGLSTR